MRYEDASSSFDTAAQGTPDARNDADALAAGSRGPATGNTITGEGTITGIAGADIVANGPGQIVALEGAGGSDTSDGGSLSVQGRFGELTMDASGGYSYRPNDASPEGGRDVFRYTLADADGARDTATLTIDLGKEAEKIDANAQQIIPGPDGVVTLPPGVQLSDVHVVGRNLVIDMPDGSQMVIIDGAVFVPQLVLGGVEVPPSNLAALLIDLEPKPAAGIPLSSGGNFAVDVPPLDPGVPLGDLIPPTELSFTPPEFQDVGQFEEPDEDTLPSIVSADDTIVDEDGLEGANPDSSPLQGDPGETDSTEDNTDTGQIVVDFRSDVPSNLMDAIQLVDTAALDGQLKTLGGVDINFALEGGNLVGRPAGGGDAIVIISITGASAGAGGLVTYTYEVELLGPIQHADSGNNENSDLLAGVSFQVSDSDGDTATGSVDVTIVDDVPTAGTVDPERVLTFTLDETRPETTDEEGTAPAGLASQMRDYGPAFEGVVGEYGADGPGTTAMNLVLSTEGAASGLYALDGTDTLADGDGYGQGAQILLYSNEDGSISGRLTEDGEDYFTISAVTSGADAGQVTFTQILNVWHSNTGSDDEVASLNAAANTIQLVQTITDADGDTDQSGIDLSAGIFNIQDDGPRGSDQAITTTIDLVLDETRPVDTEEDGNSAPAGDDSVSSTAFAALFGSPNYGTDLPGTVEYSLALSAPGIGSGIYALEDGDTSTTDDDGYGQGAEILLFSNSDGSVVSGRLTADGPDYFTITVSSTGAVTFTQQQNVWHSNTESDDERTTLSVDRGTTFTLVQTITDADGDSDTKAIDLSDGVFHIEDDGPRDYDPCPEDVIQINQPGTSDDLPLNLPDPGTDLDAVVSFGVEDGDEVLDNDGNQLSSGGEDLFYFVNGDVLEARMTDENGDIVFTITLNGDGTFTYDQILPITSETELSITDLSSVGGGNVDAKVINVEDSPFDLILSTAGGETVNTNATQIGISSGNSFEAGEVLRVDLVQNAFVTGSGGGAVINYGEYYSANSYQQTVSLQTGAGSNFIVRAITVDEAPGSNVSDPADGDNVFYGDANDDVVAVTAIKIFDDNGDEVDATLYATAAVGGGWQITGLPDDYSFQISSATQFQAVQILATAGTGTFKLGFIDITTIVQSSVGFEVPIVLTDADGDSVTCEIDVNLGPPTSSPDVTAQVDEAGLQTIGSDESSDSEIVTGDLSAIVSGGSGTTTFALQGTGAGTHGTLQLNADGTYTYTLTSPIDSDPDLNDGDNVEPAVETFTYEMIQGGHVVGTGTLTINVVDDVPIANDDTLGGTQPENAAVTIDVFANDVAGADGVDIDNAPAVKVSVVGETLTGTGTLEYNEDGTFTYTPSAGESGEISFQYQIVDGDGDIDTATATFTIAPDSVPTVAVTDLTVDEQGLPAGTGEMADLNAGNNSDPSEKSGTGTMTITTGGDTLSAVEVQDKDGAWINVTAATVGSPIAVTGTHGTLSVTSDGAGHYSYTYTLSSNYTTHTDTLVPPADGDSNEGAADPLNGDAFAVRVTDSDTDQTSSTPAATSIINVTVLDDAPIANNDSVNQSGEDANVTISPFGNDFFGADGVNLVTGISFTQPPAGQGTVTYSTVTNQFTFDPVPGQTGSTSFTYTLTDGDGDTATATVNITLAADSTPTVAVTDLTVDEQGLPLGTGEQADFGLGVVVRASNNSDTSETSSAGSMTITTGGDTLNKVEVQASNGTWIDVTAATVGTPITVTGTHGTLSVTSSGGVYSYTYTLTSNYDTHPDTIVDGDGIEGTADPLNGDAFAVRVTDSDTDVTSSTPAATAIINVSVLDDAPTVYAGPAALNITNSGTVSGTANFDFAIGADQRSSYSAANSDFTLPVLTGTVGGNNIGTPTVTWSSETATSAVFNLSFTYLAGGVTQTETGTLTLDKATGSYTVDLANPILANTFSSIANASPAVGYADGSNTPMASNPDVSVIQLNNGMYVQFSGYAGAADDTQTSPDPVLSAGDNQAFVDGEYFVQARDYVTISGLGGNGVHGDTMNKGEVLDFDIFNSSTNPTGFTNLTPNGSVESLFVMLDGIGNNEDAVMLIKLLDTTNGTFTTKAVYVGNEDFFKQGDTDGGKYQGVVASLDSNDALIVIEQDDYNTVAQPGRYVIVGAQLMSTNGGIDGSAINLNGNVDLYNASNVLIQDGATTGAATTIAADTDDTGFKIKDIGFVTTTTQTQSASLNFALQLVDSEGDKSPVQNLVVTVTPVVLDTDHDGSVEYLSQDAGVRYDYNGDGAAEATGWAAAGDSILVRDADGNGTVTDASEFVFGGNGVTDLEALAAQYGEALDASDADYGQFKVWNDANSNGVAEAGELQSLSAAGITSISLVSDGVASVEAGGDVLVAGNATYTYVNEAGETVTGVLGDAAFVVDSGDEDQQQLKTAANNNSVLLGAIAAAGLGTSSLVAAEEYAPSSQDTGMDLQSQDGGAALQGGEAIEGETSRSALDGETREALDAQPVGDTAKLSPSESDDPSLDSPEINQTADPVTLLEGTELAASEPAQSTLTSASVGMPSAEMLQAADATDGVEGGAKSTGEVSRVIAEALEGGADGPSIDAVIDAVANHNGGSAAAIEALATPGDVDVSGWHMPTMGGFTEAHASLTMETMVLHPDAVQAA